MTGKTVVPEEAVEAAARAQYEARYGDGRWPFCPFPDIWRDSARKGLEAAAPFIAAKAWDEGYNAGKRVMVELMSPTHSATEKPNPYRAAARGEG